MNHAIEPATQPKARWYQVGETYAVIVVDGGEHRFYECKTQEEAEYLAEKLNG